MSFAMLFVILACTERTSADLPAVAPIVASPPADKPSSPAIEVLHRGAWTDAFVFLIGIDQAEGRALLEVSSHSEGRFAFIVVDYREGVRLERWDAASAHARDWTPSGNQFGPISSTREADLARLGALIASLDPMNLAGWPPVAASPDGKHLATTENDELWLSDADGKRVRMLSQGQRAGYHPSFSPDGTKVAWIGTAKGQGYGLYVAAVDGRVHRVQATDTGALRPFWSPDGAHVYVQNTQIPVRELGTVCLSVVPVDGQARPGAVRKVGCVDAVTQAHVFFDPTGAAAVMAGRLADPEGTTRYTLFAVPSGGPIATQDVAGGGILPLLLPDGRILTGAQEGTLLIDLRSGRSALVGPDRLSGGVFSGQEAAGSLILLRSFPDRGEGVWTWEIVRLHPDRVLPLDSSRG